MSFADACLVRMTELVNDPTVIDNGCRLPDLQATRSADDSMRATALKLANGWNALEGIEFDENGGWPGLRSRKRPKKPLPTTTTTVIHASSNGHSKIGGSASAVVLGESFAFASVRQPMTREKANGRRSQQTQI
jgi:hypothetical protein